MKEKSSAAAMSDTESEWTAIESEASNKLVDISLSADSKQSKILITLTPPTVPSNVKLNKRAPVDICCVIDVSGSMGSEAPIPGDPAQGGQTESTGLTVLDVVKHSLRTIIATMTEDDRIALVTFSSNAEVVSGLTNMSESGKTSVLQLIEKLYPSGATNLWDGLKNGMNVLNNASRGVPASGRLSTVFLLTDGMPTVKPPRDHIPMLKMYLDSNPTTRPFSISTFGFGYFLDSPLLLEIAQVGGGGYSFIPDSGMVGTVFVHSVANVYSTYASRAKLDVEVPSGVEVKVLGGLSVVKTSWGVQVDAGDMQFGQTRSYVFSLSKWCQTGLMATVTYTPFTSDEELKTETVSLDSSTPSDTASIAYHSARLDLVKTLFGANSKNLIPSTKSLESLAKEINASALLANHTDALALARDASGEGLLGLESKNFERWGRHYFPSLARAHQRQQCGNFKDPGLQVYGRGSPVFIEERDKLDAAFDALPPPKPSLPTSYGHGRSNSGGGGSRGGATTSSRAPLESMARYRSAAGPCFAGHCYVKLFDGAIVRVDELKRGMNVATMRGSGQVAAVVKTVIPSGETMLCEVGENLLITPWHPIVDLTDNWVFPATVCEAKLLPCDAIYSVLLVRSGSNVASDAHTLCIGGVWCVTLGHGLTDTRSQDVRAHQFLGSHHRVLRDLSALDGFYSADGVVECSGLRRSGVDGSICGFADVNREQKMVPILPCLRSVDSLRA